MCKTSLTIEEKKEKSVPGHVKSYPPSPPVNSSTFSGTDSMPDIRRLGRLGEAKRKKQPLAGRVDRLKKKKTEGFSGSCH